MMLQDVTKASVKRIAPQDAASRRLRYLWGPLAMVGVLMVITIGTLVFEGRNASAEEHLEDAYAFAGIVLFLLPTAVIGTLILGSLVIKKKTYKKTLKIVVISIIGLGVIGVIQGEYSSWREKEWQKSLPELTARETEIADNARSITECGDLELILIWEQCMKKTVSTRDDVEVCMGQVEGEHSKSRCQNIFDDKVLKQAKTPEDCNQIYEEKKKITCRQMFEQPTTNTNTQ